MDCNTRYCLTTPSLGRHTCNKCRSRQRRAAYPVQATYQTLRSNARRRLIEFTLTIEEWTTICEQSDYIKLRGVTANSLTVDRKDPRLGYSVNNIQIITKAANSRKAKTDALLKMKGNSIKPSNVPF